MNTYKWAFIGIFLFSFLNSGAQQLTRKQQERENNKVEIYTSEEKDNLQMWFHEQVKDMNLSNEVDAQYFGILVNYTSSMMRLNDKDKDYTEEEIKTRFDRLVEKLNNDVKPILTEEQYKMHLENFGRIVRSAQAKLKKNKN